MVGGGSSSSTGGPLGCRVALGSGRAVRSTSRSTPEPMGPSDPCRDWGQGPQTHFARHLKPPWPWGWGGLPTGSCGQGRAGAAHARVVRRSCPWDGPLVRVLTAINLQPPAVNQQPTATVQQPTAINYQPSSSGGKSALAFFRLTLTPWHPGLGRSFARSHAPQPATTPGPASSSFVQTTPNHGAVRRAALVRAFTRPDSHQRSVTS